MLLANRTLIFLCASSVPLDDHGGLLTFLPLYLAPTGYSPFGSAPAWLRCRPPVSSLARSRVICPTEWAAVRS
jgi:hypothetical protein